MLPRIDLGGSFQVGRLRRKKCENGKNPFSARCLGACHVVRNVFPRGNAAKLHVPPRAPATQPLKLAFPPRHVGGATAFQGAMIPQQAQESLARWGNTLDKIFLCDACVQRRRVHEASRCGHGKAFRACPRGPSPCTAVFCGAAQPPRVHLLQQRLTRTPRQATSMHMPQICRSDACVSMFGGTKGTQCSPLRCSALRGCPGACCACRSATTGLSKLRCHSMQRCFQHLVLCVQRSSHMRHHWLALKTGTESTLRHDMSSCHVMPEAMHGHSRHAPRHCALMPAVEGVRRA